MKLSTLPFAMGALLALAACDQPKWREADKATAPQAAAPAGPPPQERVIPAVAGPTPPAPAWVAGQVGKLLHDVYPKSGVCTGNTDIVQQTYAGPPAGVQIHGWGWDLARKARVERVVLVDADSKIVGGGAGGVARPDVPQNAPDVRDGATGWNADVARSSGALDAYGVVEGGDAVCPLGHIEF